MRLAIIGTGFVIDYYMTTLKNHPALELAGVFDVDAKRLRQFCDYYDVTAYPSLDALLKDDTVDMVAVLTTPETHFNLSSAALAADKHVYCEKPLAMNIADAHALVAQADKAGLVLAGAPANAHSPAFQATKTLLEQNEIGPPKLVYAQMEDGAVFRDNWQKWRSISGAPWPGKHEFEIGCTLEHAGYAVSWLTGLFGSVKHIHGTSATLFFDKGVDIEPENMAPDFSTTIMHFESGVIARLTCGLCAPKDRSMTIMANDGTITVTDLWDNSSRIHIEKKGERPNFIYRMVRRLEAKLGSFLTFKPNAGRKVRYGGKKDTALPAFPSQIDFAAGLEAVRKCVEAGGLERASLAAQALHSTEAVLALNQISDLGGRYEMTTTLASAKSEA